EVMATLPEGFGGGVGVAEGAVQGAAESRSSRPVVARPTTGNAPRAEGGGGPGAAGGMGRRRVLVHSSGFTMSPYADVKPPGEDTKSAPRQLWPSSPGSSGG